MIKPRPQRFELCDTLNRSSRLLILPGPETFVMEIPEKPLSLLLVDDDVELCGMMKEFFAAAGHSLHTVNNGREGLARALQVSYDLLILDVMLPELDGFAVLRQLRQHKNLPVIMLTARVHRNDRILGLNMGADDYLPKPFDPDELMARIQAVLRRASPAMQPTGATLTAGKIRLDLSTREVWSAGAPVDLTSMEFDLLELLMRSKGSVVSRDVITARLFEREATPYDRFLDVHISHLRTKLHGGRGLIRAIRGVGYVFTGKD
jgi:DNA-binding response OmpR family regulator